MIQRPTHPSNDDNTIKEGTNQMMIFWKFAYTCRNKCEEYDVSFEVGTDEKIIIVSAVSLIYARFNIIIETLEVLKGNGVGRTFKIKFDSKCQMVFDGFKNENNNETDILKDDDYRVMDFDIAGFHEKEANTLDYHFTYKSKTYKLSSKFLNYACPKLLEINFSEVLNGMDLPLETIDLFVHFLFYGSLSTKEKQFKQIDLVSVLYILLLADHLNMGDLLASSTCLFYNLCYLKWKAHYNIAPNISPSKSINENGEELSDQNLVTHNQNIFNEIIDILVKGSPFILLDEKTHRQNCNGTSTLVTPVKAIYETIFDRLMSEISELTIFIEKDCYKLLDTLKPQLFMYILKIKRFSVNLDPYTRSESLFNPHAEMIKRIKKTLPVIVNGPRNVTTTADNTLSHDLKSLGYDFIFYSKSDDNHGIAVHRWILSSRWSWFANMMTFAGPEFINGIVVLDEWRLESIKFVLNYLYTGCIKCMTFTIMFDIIRYAEFYNLRHENDILISTVVSSLNLLYHSINYEEILKLDEQ